MRLILSIAMQLVANAIGLIVANALLEDFHLNASGFLIAVGVFTLIAAIVQPMIRQAAMKNAQALLGSTALVVSLVALVVTTLITDGLSISGLTTWVLAAVVVWAAGLIATMLLPIYVFKQLREERGR
jgi:uncharacterized membrane protein YvlD (DUF360 family)